MRKQNTCGHLQSGHSAFFKKKSSAIKCKKQMEKDPGQVKLRIKKTVHTLRGKGWLLHAGRW